ncbi:cGMP-dependent 3',5'-cyclic phosphodiesterase, partial [Geodia barretti]
KEIDTSTGFHTRNILCFPIKNNTGDVVGVAELCNKVGGNFFTKYDQELAATFSVYCGISLYHATLYRKLEITQTNSKLSTELMLYHMQVSTEEVEKLATKDIVECTEFSEAIATFTYTPRSIPDARTAEAVISMCSAMGLTRRWKLQPSTLAKFILMVKRSYRDPPYHNWYHALSVAHFCYVLHQRCDNLSFLTDLEVLALFFSCLCHDIDHRGTNNSFQISSKSVLASLYSSEGSVMERHHFSQTLCVLNSEGCNIFANLGTEEYKQVLDLMQS